MFPSKPKRSMNKTQNHPHLLGVYFRPCVPPKPRSQCLCPPKRAMSQTYCGRNPAPKKPWHDDCPANTNHQWFQLFQPWFLRRCQMKRCPSVCFETQNKRQKPKGHTASSSAGPTRAPPHRPADCQTRTYSASEAGVQEGKARGSPPNSEELWCPFWDKACFNRKPIL